MVAGGQFYKSGGVTIYNRICTSQCSDTVNAENADHLTPIWKNRIMHLQTTSLQSYKIYQLLAIPCTKNYINLKPRPEAVC